MKMAVPGTRCGGFVASDSRNVASGTPLSTGSLRDLFAAVPGRDHREYDRGERKREPAAFVQLEQIRRQE
jgi:hypothetical protein